MATIKGLINQNELESLIPFVYDGDYREYSFQDNIKYKQGAYIFEDVLTITEKGVANPFKFDVGGISIGYTTSVNNDPILTGGYLTGVKASAKSGSGWSEILAIGGFQVDAKAFYEATLTPEQDDDITIFQTILAGSDIFTLSNQADIARGYAGNDKLYGLAGNDVLNGGLGNDLIDAGDGNDLIIGEAGKDSLKGGKGLDTFLYTSLSDSGVGSSQRDSITDFKGQEGEIIDLSAIDADAITAGDQAFTYIGSAGFTGSPAEVRFHKGVLQINTGADTNTDMEIAFTGLKTFNQSFLVL